MSSRSSYILSGVATAVIAAGLAAVLYVQINALAAEKDSAVRGLADEHNRASRLQADLAQMKQDYDVQKAAYGELVRGKQAVEQDRDGWKGRAEKAEHEQIEAREREAAAMRQLESTKDDYEKSKTAFVALEGELKMVQAKLSETETSLSQTKEALEKAERERNEAR
jgi:chromosome segregation ATPase